MIDHASSGGLTAMTIISVRRRNRIYARLRQIALLTIRKNRQFRFPLLATNCLPLLAA